METHIAVVLGANYYVGLSVARCLGKHNVTVVATRMVGHERVQYGLKSRYVSEILDLPNLTDNPEAAVESLLNYGARCESKPVLIATGDLYLLFIDRYLDILREGFLLPSVQQGLYKELVDKNTLSELAAKTGIKTPKTFFLPEVTADRSLIASSIGYPCLVKPVNSFKFSPIFRSKLFVADNEEQLVAALKKCQEHNIEVVVQQLIPGFDDQMFTYDCYIDSRGAVTHYATCQKHRQFPANFGASTFVKPLHMPQLHQIGSRFLKQVGYHGFAEIEFKRDAESGQFYMIEVNARITNFNALLERIGFNVPYAMVEDLTGRGVTRSNIDRDADYYFWSGYEDFAAIRQYVAAKQMTILKALKSLTVRKVNAAWSWSDPYPFWVFVVEKIRGAIKKRLRPGR